MHVPPHGRSCACTHSPSAVTPPPMQIKCLTGCVEAKVLNTVAQGKPQNFDEWIMRVMGPGIADLFMRPYNFKARVAVGGGCVGVGREDPQG